MNPWVMCVSIFVCLCVHICVLCVSVSVPMSVFICVSYVFLCMFVGGASVCV